MVVPVRVLSMGQINLFANYLHQIGILDIIWLATCFDKYVNAAKCVN